MADNKLESNKSDKPKRRIKAAAPSVREAAEQHQARALKPSRKETVGRAVAKPFKYVGWQLAKVGRLKPFHILGLILWPRYFRNAFRELQKVTWPDRRTTFRLSVAVLIFSIIFGLTVAGLDWGLDKIFRKVILQQ